MQCHPTTILHIHVCFAYHTDVAIMQRLHNTFKSLQAKSEHYKSRLAELVSNLLFSTLLPQPPVVQTCEGMRERMHATLACRTRS